MKMRRDARKKRWKGDEKRGEVGKSNESPNGRGQPHRPSVAATLTMLHAVILYKAAVTYKAD